MGEFIDALQTTMGESIPGILGALAILIVGWLIAAIVKGLLKKSLSQVPINDVVSKNAANRSVDLVNAISSGAYFLILLITLVAVFNQLKLEVASIMFEQFVSDILHYMPNILGGCALILATWLGATVVKQVLSVGLKGVGIDKKLASEKPLSETISEIAYWFIFLLLLPAVLSVFRLDGILSPIQSMVQEILATIPNLLASVLIILVGWFVARILKEVVVNMLAAGGIDKLGEKIGFSGKSKISDVAGLAAYYVTLIPAIISGLDAAQIYAISKPATDMLHSIFMSLPNILAAIGIVILVYLVSKPVAKFACNILEAVGVNRIPEKLGLPGLNNLTQTIGKIIVFFMVMFAIVEAANLLKFEKFSNMMAMLIQFGGQILLGSVIIIAGLWIANLAASSVNKTSKEGPTGLAVVVRVLVLFLAVAMGLRAMGLANDIVNMAFALTLGAAAVAFAIAFGFGGRDAAAKYLGDWMAKSCKK